MDQLAVLTKKLDQINERIAEAEARLGAHSVKPILMQQLFALEEERAVILQAIKALKGGCTVCPS